MLKAKQKTKNYSIGGQRSEPGGKLSCKITACTSLITVVVVVVAAAAAVVVVVVVIFVVFILSNCTRRLNKSCVGEILTRYCCSLA